MLTIFATTDKIANQDVTCEPGDEFAILLDWAKENGLSLRHDPESDARLTGWYIDEPTGEFDADGVGVTAQIGGAYYLN